MGNPKTNVDYIIFSINQVHDARRYGFELNNCNRNLKEAILHFWENKECGLNNWKNLPCSAAAKKKGCKEGCVREHAVPFKIIIEKLLAREANAKNVKAILKKWHHVYLVTKEEDHRLLKAGLRFEMPENWNRKDVFARYKAVGIRRHRRNEIPRLPR